VAVTYWDGPEDEVVTQYAPVEIAHAIQELADRVYGLMVPVGQTQERKVKSVVLRAYTDDRQTHEFVLTHKEPEPVA